jgi:hypothetical protein
MALGGQPFYLPVLAALTGEHMSPQAELRCRCGAVRGVVTNASQRAVNRVVCYCDDCQAFVHQLGRPDLLDAQGGSDIVQLAPASLSFAQGQDRIKGVRLKPGGLYRWYASCCNTPVGNTASPAIPFVGIIATAFDHDTQRADDVFGKPVGAIFGKYAVGQAPEGSTGVKPSLLLRAIGKILGWRLGGKVWPHPFFKRDVGAPVYPVHVLSPGERDALRPLCGPHPTAPA